MSGESGAAKLLGVRPTTLASRIRARWGPARDNVRLSTLQRYLRDAFARAAGLRIDHFLLSPQIAKRLKSAGVDRDVRGWEHPSDHAPVWMEVKEESKRKT